MLNSKTSEILSEEGLVVQDKRFWVDKRFSPHDLVLDHTTGGLARVLVVYKKKAKLMYYGSMVSATDHALLDDLELMMTYEDAKKNPEFGMEKRGRISDGKLVYDIQRVSKHNGSPLFDNWDTQASARISQWQGGLDLYFSDLRVLEKLKLKRLGNG